MFKLLCCLSLIVLVCQQQLEAAPTHAQQKALLDMSQSELMHKFEQFVHEDKQESEIRQFYEKEIHDHAMRKRQVEANDMDGMDASGTDIQKAEGFLDRAAQFVLELVQRFLKWINTD